MKLRSCVLAHLLAVYMFAQSPPADAGTENAAMVERIDNAIELSVSCFESLPRLSSDERWFLIRGERHLETDRFRRMLQGFQAGLPNDGVAALIDLYEELPPASGPKPWQELIALMRESLACRQGNNPSQELEVFINEQHKGYVLTHQILAIEWARSLGCALPTQWYVREKALADRALSELQASPVFNDLFAERMAVLAVIGRADSLQQSSVERLLQAQSTDGCWRSPRERIRMSFRGHTLISNSEVTSPTHTSSLAVCALAHYRAIIRNENEVEP